MIFWKRVLKEFHQHILLWLLKKNIILYSLNWPNFIIWLPLFFAVMSNICIVIVCFPCYDVINFKDELNFLIKPFFFKTKNSGQKILISRDQRELLRWNRTHFSKFLKGIQLPNIVSNLGVRLYIKYLSSWLFYF